jgi:hypothetical protein
VRNTHLGGFASSPVRSIWCELASEQEPLREILRIRLVPAPDVPSLSESAVARQEEGSSSAGQACALPASR